MNKRILKNLFCARALLVCLLIAAGLLLAQTSRQHGLQAEAQTATCGVFNWDRRFGGKQGVNGTVSALALSPTGELLSADVSRARAT